MHHGRNTMRGKVISPTNPEILKNTVINQIRPVTSPESLRRQSKIYLLPQRCSSTLRSKPLSLLIDEANKAKKEINELSSIQRKNDDFTTLFKDSEELCIIAKHLCEDICDSSHDTKLSNVIGLDEAKRILYESMILPTMYPNLFKGLLQPFRGLLVYGLPGTGKSFLAKAISRESGSTFFNMPASSVVSKYRGESEKIIRVLFTLARHYSPSIIFFDEADSIMGVRSSFGGEQQEHEGSRRMKTELLVEMDGIRTSDHRIFVLAATNLPWEIDGAFLRRLEKRVLIPLPEKCARKCLLKEYLSDHLILLGDEEVDTIADLLENFSPCDIKMVCKDVMMTKVRNHLDRLNKSSNSSSVSSSPNDMDLETLLKNDPITALDMELSIRKTRRAPTSDWMKRYSDWEAIHGLI